jgi:hypothetical protein
MKRNKLLESRWLGFWDSEDSVRGCQGRSSWLEVFQDG